MASSPIPSVIPMMSIISEKLIKPISPTPPTQRWYKLSLLDQIYSNNYLPFAFFYTKKQLNDASIDPTRIPLLLEESLSKTLTSYYPYAGRLKDNTIVDCNDAGAELVQVQINFPISEALQYHNDSIEEMVFPKGLPWSDCSDRGLVVAQISYFKCGGIAVSVCISHKVGDGCSASILMTDWAATTRDQPNDDCSVQRSRSRCDLHYVQDSIFPPPPTGTPFLHPLRTSTNDDCSVQRRYTFSVQKLDELKASVAAAESSTVQNPTRPEVVSALLFKYVVAASNAANSDNSLKRPWLMSQSIDLRQQIGLSPYSIGNVLTTYLVILTEENMTLSNIVTEMRKAEQQVRDNDNVKDNQLLKQFLQYASSEGKKVSMKSQDYVCLFSNQNEYPFHEADFGWGKPAKLSMAKGLYKRAVILLGNQNGGLDALVTLPKQEMSIFNHNNVELLKYGSHVPCVI